MQEIGNLEMIIPCKRKKERNQLKEVSINICIDFKREIRVLKGVASLWRSKTFRVPAGLIITKALHAYWLAKLNYWTFFDVMSIKKCKAKV